MTVIVQVLCSQCSENDGVDYPFNVLTGQELRCPKCRKLVEVEPVDLESLGFDISRETGGNQAIIKREKE